MVKNMKNVIKAVGAEEVVKTNNMVVAFFNAAAKLEGFRQGDVSLSDIELGEAFFISKVRNLAEKSARKILWLNTVSKKEGYSFLTKRYDLEKIQDCIEIVESFYDLIQQGIDSSNFNQ